MGEFLTSKEMKIVKKLKERGVLKKIAPGELTGLTKNGGVAIICGDGDIDARSYHKKIVTKRPHCIMVFGGPLVFAPSFRGYSACFAESLLHNMSLGMEAKDTGTALEIPHWPCGVGAMFNYSMETVIFDLVPEANEALQKKSKKTRLFFHLKKRFEDGHIEQNTYDLVLP